MRGQAQSDSSPRRGETLKVDDSCSPSRQWKWRISKEGSTSGVRRKNCSWLLSKAGTSLIYRKRAMATHNRKTSDTTVTTLS